VIAAAPDAEPAAPWRLASDVVAVPTEFRIAGAAFDGVRQLHRDGGAITIADDLRVSLQ